MSKKLYEIFLVDKSGVMRDRLMWYNEDKKLVEEKLATLREKIHDGFELEIREREI